MAAKRDNERQVSRSGGAGPARCPQPPDARGRQGHAPHSPHHHRLRREWVPCAPVRCHTSLPALVVPATGRAPAAPPGGGATTPGWAQDAAGWGPWRRSQVRWRRRRGSGSPAPLGPARRDGTSRPEPGSRDRPGRLSPTRFLSSSLAPELPKANSLAIAGASRSPVNGVAVGGSEH